MESEVSSEYVKNYFPTPTELRNFKDYVKKIANDGVSAAKISVPMDLMENPISIRESLKLKNVQIQKVAAKQLPNGSIGYMLNTSTTSDVTFNEYREMAQKYGQQYDTFGMTHMEDKFWEMLNKQTKDWEAYLPRYSIDNSFSLFAPSTQFWNLAKFTGQESEIHRVNILILNIFLEFLCNIICI